MDFRKRFKDFMGNQEEDIEESEQYLEIQTSKKKPSLIVRSFALKEFEDLRPVIKTLRTGQYVVLVDLKPLRDNDLVDLRRAVNKLKAVNAEIAGDIAGLSNDWIVITPHPVKIEKSKPKEEPADEELL